MLHISIQWIHQKGVYGKHYTNYGVKMKLKMLLSNKKEKWQNLAVIWFSYLVILNNWVFGFLSQNTVKCFESLYQGKAENKGDSVLKIKWWSVNIYSSGGRELVIRAQALILIGFQAWRPDEWLSPCFPRTPLKLPLYLFFLNKSEPLTWCHSAEGKHDVYPHGADN